MTTTLDKLKASIDHLEDMNENIARFHALRAVCMKKHAKKIEFHLQQLMDCAKQDRKNIAQYAAQLLQEGE